MDFWDLFYGGGDPEIPLPDLILYHGTPFDFEGAAIEKRSSFFDAIWLSTSVDVATIYAGPSGYVHTMQLSPETRLLVACGTFENKAWNYPTPAEWERVVRMLLDRHVVIDEFDCLDPLKIGHFQPPLGPEGQPAWEGILDDFCGIPGDAEEILVEMGFDAIARTERVELCLGDRSQVIRDNLDAGYAGMISAAKSAKKRPVVTIAVFNRDVLEPRSVQEAVMRKHPDFAGVELHELGSLEAQPEPSFRL